MVNWLRNFWYHDTIDEMQRKMLLEITSNRPSLDNFVRRSVRRWKISQFDNDMRIAAFLRSR